MELKKYSGPIIHHLRHQQIINDDHIRESLIYGGMGCKRRSFQKHVPHPIENRALKNPGLGLLTGKNRLRWQGEEGFGIK
ncbi:MAG: hypothetical protein ACHQK8_00280 [Bacteroidia bacterium]